MRHSFFPSLQYDLLACLVAFVLCVTGCGATSVNGTASAGNPAPVPELSSEAALPAAAQGVAVLPLEPSVPKAVDVSWGPLLERLRKEAPASAYDKYFTGLEPYSSAPMSTKIKELHRSLVRPKTPPATNGTKRVYSSIYRGFVTAETVKKCNDFLTAHKAAFDLMEQRYKVPKETVVALLYVETKLGTYLGKEKAFWSLACMAAADKPELVNDGITSLAIKPSQQTWLQAKLTEKSSWAYKELKALLAHCAANGLDPQSMPGSVYGAIGVCQFMPSNLKPYGDDGNGDGKIDLFNEADAIVSVGKYLAGHGWKGTMTVAQQRQVLKRYNNLNRYANTILALAASVKTGTLYSGPPDAPKVKKAPAKKTAPKAAGKSAGKTGKATSKKNVSPQKGQATQKAGAKKPAQAAQKAKSAPQAKKAVKPSSKAVDTLP